MQTITKRVVFFIIVVILLSGGLYVVLMQGFQLELNAHRPNIIVIIADDLGWNDVSFHGSNQVPTPNLDALAYHGVILQRHYVLPICTPSRTAFLTGRYPIRTGMQGYPLRAGEPRAIPLNNTLLPEYLRKLGYTSHLVGKWHVGYYSDYHTPAYRGFDTFFGYYNGYITFFNHTIVQNNYTGHDLHYDVPGRLSAEYDYQYITDLITDKAENIIANHDRRRPLYLQLAHAAAHSTDSEDIMEVRDEKKMNATLGYIEDFGRRKLAGVVTALDESVGRVVKALKEAEMLENSIIVFMSDNGAPTVGSSQNYGSNYPLRGIKLTLFDGGIRGVACIYSPLIKSVSRISDSLMHITDWLPTFYSAAGGNLEDLGETLDGVDQWDTIVSAKGTGRTGVLLNIDEVANVSSALIGRYKLLNGAVSEYPNFYGDNGINKLYPQYNTSSVLRSLAGSAIAKISKSTLKDEDVIKLREKATVTCKNFTTYSTCLHTCLFDVYNDPCETTDLSLEYPKIVDELNHYIKEYSKVLMPQTNAPVNSASLPQHFNGTWMPWIVKYPLHLIS
ncbi:arylsulfatase B-like isoform X1 [Hylaeus anthracinus]|uniref:arylsulfatase B-like isoform X1 n=2 Tax=Hylaeus anthracinus TaxID=313031 RepID=UPI0023B98782|nr:arylsulfatase B-like isoform X1 [Hylaeus anthracinus]